MNQSSFDNSDRRQTLIEAIWLVWEKYHVRESRSDLGEQQRVVLLLASVESMVTLSIWVGDDHLRLDGYVFTLREVVGLGGNQQTESTALECSSLLCFCC